MADMITLRALEIARDKHGWNQAEFADAIGADKQHVTNWKARGFPPARYAKAAQVLGITVEELISGKKQAQDAPHPSRIEEPSVAAYDVKVTPEAMMFAAEYLKLPKALQSQVSALVHMMVAELAREARVTPSGPKTPKTSIKPSQRRTERHNA